MPTNTKSDDFLDALIGSAPFGIIAIDLSGKIEMINNRVIEYLDSEGTSEDIHGQNINLLIGHIQILKETIEKFLKKGKKPFNLVAIPVNKKFLTFRGRLIQNQLIITIENVSKLKEIEASSLYSMIAGQEQERKRIAREIHDGIGPLLSTIKIYLESASDDLKEGKNNKVFEKIANITQMIDSVAIDIRSISHDLMPRVLEDFGLVAALENLCDKMNKLNKINVTFYTSGINGRFKKLEFGIYRIAQELMNNAFKHSEAKNLTLQLIQHKNSIVLMAEDNGRGFDLVKITKENTGIGLKNVEARVKALGGILDIDTAIGRGVTTTIEIPITN